jgi:hypothetical protein
MSRLAKCGRCCLPLLTTVTLGAAAAAQDFGPVSIHGAGGTTFGVTDGPNAYLSGTPENSWDTHDFALTVLATPSERLLVGAQVWWGVHNTFSDDAEVNLLQAFAQYKFADALKLRAGVMRQPFGLYSETLEMGTQRPFINLPRGVYASASQQWDGYQGLGVTGTVPAGESWLVEYDVYGGSMWADGSGLANPLLGEIPEDSSTLPDIRLRDVIGARVRLRTPVDGLSVGVASYAGTFDGFALSSDRNYVYLGSIEYLDQPWSLRAEYARRYLGAALGQAAYVEAAYRFGSHWEVAGRWDWTEVDFGAGFPPALQVLFEHRDIAAGLNYHVNDGLVLKASVHEVEGNFFAGPLDGLDFAAGETADPDTRLLQIGAQFSF